MNVRALVILALALLLAIGLVTVVRSARQRAIMTTSLELARAAEQRADWPGAARAYRRYLEKKQGDVEVLRAFARAHLATRPLDAGNLVAARDAFWQIQRYAPDDTQAWQKLCQLRYMLSEFDELIVDATRARARGVERHMAALWVARGQAGAGSLRDAHETLDALLKEFERQPDAAAAAVHAQVLIESADLLALLSTKLDGANGRETARAELDRVSMLLPNAAEPMIARARLARSAVDTAVDSESECAAARGELERAAAAQFVDPLARIELAGEWIELGEFERARAALAAADNFSSAEIAERCIDPDDWTVPLALCKIELALRQSRPSDALPIVQDLLANVGMRRQRLRLLPAAARVFLALGRTGELAPIVKEYSKLHRLTVSGTDVAADLLEAQLALAEDRPEDAVRLLEPVVAREAKNATALRSLAAAYEKLDRTTATIEALSKVRQLQPQSADVAIALVRAYVKRRDWAGAIEAARWLEQLRPGDVPTLVLRMQIEVSRAIERTEPLNSEEWDERENDLKRMLADHPRVVELHVLAGSIAAERGRTGEAEQRLREAVSTCDEPLPARLALVTVLLSQRRNAEATLLAEEAVQQHAAAMQAWIALADVARADGRIDDALLSLDRGAKAVASARDRSALQTRAARIELSADRRAAAITRLEQVAAANLHDSRSRSILLTLPEILGDSAAAGQLLNQLCETVGQNSPLCKLHRGMLLLESPDWRARRSEISRLFSECASFDPQWPAPTLLLGTLYERAGDLPAAETVYRKGLLRNPAAADVADRLLRLLDSQNRLAEAAPLLEGLKLRPRVAASLRLTTALATGAFDEAIEEARLRVVADERDPESRLLLARLLYQSRRDVPGALEQLDALDRVQPNTLVSRTLRIAILRHENRVAEARALLDGDIRDRPSVRTYLLRAEFLAAIGEPVAAERDYRHVLELDPIAGAELLGEFLLEHERVADAIEVWRAGIAAGPTSASMEKRLMRTLMLQPGLAERAEGLALLSKLELAIPDDPELMRVRAYVSRETGGQDGARKAAELLEKVVAIEPSSVDAQRGLITLSIERGDMHKAREQVIRALGAVNGSEPSLVVLRASVELSLGNAGLASELAKGVLKSSPAQPDARVVLVKAAVAIGEPAALAEAQQLAGSGPAGDGEEAQLAYARLLHALGRTPDAIEFVAAFRATPDGARSAAALLLLVDLLRVAGRLDDAIAQLDAAAALAASVPDIDRHRVALLVEGRRWDALAGFVAGVNPRDPERRPIYLAGAAALADAEKAEIRTRAVELFDRVAKDGDSVDARLGLAYSLTRAGQVDRAVDIYREILKVDQRNTRALNELSCLLAQKEGDSEAALELTSRGLALEPANDFLLDTRGTILLKSDRPNRLGEARDCLEKAALLRRSQPAARARTLLRLGAVCRRLDDRLGGRRVLKELRELNQKSGVLDAQQLMELEALARELEDGAA